MTDDSDRTSAAPAKAGRRERLAEQLRANLQRRKAQARARRGGEADRRPDGLAVAPPDPAGSGSDQ